MTGDVVDGNDVLAVRDATDRLVDEVRRTCRPALLEAKTYRVRPHTEIETAPYQDTREIDDWRARDPLLVARRRLAEDHGFDDARLDGIEAEAAAEVATALEQVLEEPGHAPDEDVHEWLYATGVH
jgi:TPP-dependent pyruvate/acetoin dehydrogenase alpha subunit